MYIYIYTYIRLYKSENQGLKIKKSKTKVMMQNDTPIYVKNSQIDNVERSIYLGQ